jgi:hypothetical protein
VQMGSGHAHQAMPLSRCERVIECRISEYLIEYSWIVRNVEFIRPAANLRPSQADAGEL